MRKTSAIIAALSLSIAAQAQCIPARDKAGHIKRSAYQVAKFKRLNPCPSTGKSTGACPGWVVDHMIPLCACGLDRPTNMQWQTTAAAREKDKVERSQCGD